MTFNTRTLVVVLGLVIALGPLSIDMYLPTFPALVLALHTDATAVQWSLAAYFIGLSLGQAVYGPLADRYGRKRPLYLGLVTFALASLGCALASNIEILIVMRFAQALGGCAGMVIPRAIVRDCFDTRTGAQVFSWLMLIMGVAPILAPPAGAVMLELAGWQSIFLVLTFASVACVVLVWRFIPETLPVDRRHRAPGFGRHVATQYAGLLTDRSFMRYAMAGGSGQAALFAYITGSSFVLIDIYGMAPTNFGWVFGANAAGLILAAQVNAKLLKRTTPDRILPATLTMLTVFSGLLLLVSITGWGGLPALLVALFLFVSTLGFSFPNATACALSQQAHRAGMASALLGTLQFGVATLASVVVGALAHYGALGMAGVMTVCALVALAFLWVLAPRTGAVVAQSEA